MLPPTVSRNTLHLPEQTMQFMDLQFSEVQTRLNQQSLIIRKKIAELTTLIAETQTQTKQTSEMLRVSFPTLQNTKEKLTSLEKKTDQIQLLIEDDLHFSQDVLAYETQFAAKMETLDTFTQVQANSLRNKIQKIDCFLKPLKKSLEDSEESISKQNSQFTQKLSEFSINFTQESESLKTEALKLRQSLQQISDKMATQKDFTEKERSLLKHSQDTATPKDPKVSNPTKQGEEVLDKLRDCKIDLKKAESQFLSLFENAFKNHDMTAAQKIALKTSLGFLDATNHLPGQTRAAEEALYARKVLSNHSSHEMNQELLETALVDALTNDASDYHFVECAGVNRQATDKPHKKLLIDIQKAIIRSFLEEYSNLISQRAINPFSLDDTQYSLTFKKYLRKSNQMGRMILIVNKKTQIGIPLKMDQ